MEKILLIDDDEDEFEVLQAAFGEIAPSIRVDYIEDCENLEQKVTLLKPDMIFLDLNMPRFNGIQCLKILKKVRNEHFLPVIIYSTSENSEGIKHSFENEANAYLVKPLAFEQLENVLSRIIEMDWPGRQKPKFEDFRIQY